MPQSPAIVWFRHDLRLADQPALAAALEQGGPVLPVFLWSPDAEAPWPPGAASRWWLHQSLTRLDESLRQRGSRLVIRIGPVATALDSLIAETGATAVYWTRRYEPSVIARDQAVKQSLRDAGVAAESFPGGLLFEPWEVRTQAGKCFQVFTPFWKKCCELGLSRRPLPAPDALPCPKSWPQSIDLDELQLLPRIPWDREFYDRWSPGETGALTTLQDFLIQRILTYNDSRNQPGRAGTSSLSPHLHFGEVSPLQVWSAVTRRYGLPSPKFGPKTGPATFLSEIGWREFAHHILFHFPQTAESPLRESFERFPWRTSRKDLRAWQRGRTGYPIVDAGMRELWATGWMHNRVRMIVGSFLTKDLLISWRAGAEWFWDTLVDADLANNTLGWQWISGCGADAAPYFRIFNPVSQGEKFDSHGEYVRRWVPELAGLPDEYLHRPWEASTSILRTAGVTLGENYPTPIVDHASARKRALVALAQCKS